MNQFYFSLNKPRCINIFGLLLFVLLLMNSCSSDDKASLLECNIPWADRTEAQKLIGSWSDDNYQPGSGTTVVSKTMNFQTKLCFYSDGTMKEFQISHSFSDSKNEMDSGTNVKVENGVLTYNSKNYGARSYPIKITQDEIIIDKYIHIGQGGFRKSAN